MDGLDYLRNASAGGMDYLRNASAGGLDYQRNASVDGLDYLRNASVDWLGYLRNESVDYLRNPRKAKGRSYKREKESEGNARGLPGLFLQKLSTLRLRCWFTWGMV